MERLLKGLKAAFEGLLDRVFGPADWAVIDIDGDAYALPKARLIAADKVIKTDMRAGDAHEYARTLRYARQETPEPIYPGEWL